MKTETFHTVLKETLTGGEIVDGMRNIALHKRPAQRFPQSEAEGIAKELGTADPEWTYKAVSLVSYPGFAVVEAYEPDGTFIGRF